MSPKKHARNSPLIPAPLGELMRFLVGPGRTAALAALILAGFAGAWWWGWQTVRQQVLASDAYWLSADDILVANQVQWVRADHIRQEVFHNASLQSRLSILDPDLTERIAVAFSLHPWVAKVRRVSKRHPAGVVVELDYRRPVLMVEVPGRLIPVDEEGNVLPDGDFALNVALRFPRLVGIATMPIGPPGTRWGDLRVADGAAIAALFGDRWAEYRLDRMIPVRTAEADRRPDYTYELCTRSGSRVIWGRAPGAETRGEPAAAEKVAFLEALWQRSGTLEGAAGPQEIDLPYLIRQAPAGRSLRVGRRSHASGLFRDELILDLLSHNRHLGRSLDTDPDDPLRHPHHGDRDLVADENSLSDLPG